VAGGPPGRWPNPLRRLLPRTFQGRLTVAFVGVVALVLLLVSVLIINRMDDYFTSQQTADLDLRTNTIGVYMKRIASTYSETIPVVSADGTLNPAIISVLSRESQQRFIADNLGQADVVIEFGLWDPSLPQPFIPASYGPFEMPLLAPPKEGQTREKTSNHDTYAGYAGGNVFEPYIVRVALSDPYTFRATAIANVTALLGAIALLALGLSVLVSAALTRRFTTPLRRLTEATRGMAAGDLTVRVPSTEERAGSTEMAELAVAFNTMADRVEQSVEMIRRDRDRSRDFLADVSHELRTPLAALRTFNELLKERAGTDPAARAEFLESSGQQIERLDWLAQNLLELSKLDSGLVLLDLRPDDLRTSIESAVEQHAAAARRRGIALSARLPGAPVRIRHDPPRVGQVVGNLIGNGIKFTPPGGSVTVDLAATDDGAMIEVTDTGIGIDPAELPHIFERFYRGSRSNEARGSGSGLGLAIVHSIVEMHGGRVAVESRVGGGSRFTVTLPRDPRLVAGTPAAERADVASSAQADRRNMTETSPSSVPKMNSRGAP
jgi:signal transduction histidine kinase